MATEVESDSGRIAPPFLPFQTILNTIQVFADKGVPSLVDKKTFSTASGSVQTEIVRALRFLNLIENNGSPTPALYDLALAWSEEGAEAFPSALYKVLQEAYAPIFRLPLDNITEPHLRDEFMRAYTITSDTAKKSMTFFLKAAQKAGVSISSWIKMRDRAPSKTPRRRKTDSPDKPKGSPAEGGPKPPAGSGGPSESGTGEGDSKKRNVTEHQVIVMEIMNTYPTMPKEVRKGLLEALDFLVTEGVKRV